MSHPPHRRHFAAIVTTVLAAALLAVADTPLAGAAVGDTVDGRHSGEGIVPAGGTIEVDVTGRGGTTADARVVVLNLTITAPVRDGHAIVYPCGHARPNASTINYRAGQTIANSVFAKVGDRGRVCIFTLAAAHIVADVTGEMAGSSQFQALNPARLLDTRHGFDTIDGRAAGQGRRAAGSVTEVDVTRRGGTGHNPSTVAVNVTVTGVSSTGFATVYPCGADRPNTSTLNYAAGDTVANAVLARVGDRGRICIYTHADAHLIVDVNGAISGDDDITSVVPARVLESRPGFDTYDGVAAGVGQRSDGSTLAVDLAGRGGSSSNATAISLNLTVTQGKSAGFATVYPCDEPRPTASTINFAAGQTVANAIIAKVDRDGMVCIYTHGATHVLADIDGFAPAGSSYRPLTPARLVDTRPTTPPPTTPPTDAAAASLRFLNEVRAAHGVAPVALDPAISDTALAWSEEMSRTGFRHSSAGYAENIAWHSLASMTPTEAARELNDMWVNSAGHFRNMTDPRWTHVGIGLFVDDSGWYGTHMFTD